METTQLPNRRVGQLASEEVRPILDGYDEGAVDRVFDLLTNVVGIDDRWGDAIDSKANLIVGFGAALVTASASVLGEQVHGWMAAALLVGNTTLLIAIALAFRALRARLWPSWADGALLPLARGSHADRVDLKRYWAHGLFRRHKQIEAVLRRKATALLAAQIAMQMGVLTVCAVAACLALSRGLGL